MTKENSMKVTGLFRIKAIAPSTVNLVLVTDGDFQYEITEEEYVRACNRPLLSDLPWKD
jgi:hypothetical protein